MSTVGAVRRVSTMSTGLVARSRVQTGASTSAISTGCSGGAMSASLVARARAEAAVTSVTSSCGGTVGVGASRVFVATGGAVGVVGT